VSDLTIATVGDDQKYVVDWFAYPKTRYEEQIELLVADLRRLRTCKKRLADGSIVEEEFDWVMNRSRSDCVTIAGGFKKKSTGQCSFQ
jgi:hypothetical protein